MVKKKSTKKVSKKVTKKSKPKAKSRAEVKKDFDEFAQKVAKLEAMKEELNVLDAKGFEKEVKVIRSRLKDVNAIPQIRNEIDSLRKKIQTSSKRKVQHREKVKALKKEHEEIHEDIKNLQEKLAKKK